MSEERIAKFVGLSHNAGLSPGFIAAEAHLSINEVRELLEQPPKPKRPYDWMSVHLDPPQPRHAEPPEALSPVAVNDTIARQKNTFLAGKYRRLAYTRGKQKALVATERTLLALIWTLLSTGTLYDEPGPDWYIRQHPARQEPSRTTTVRPRLRNHPQPAPGRLTLTPLG